MLPQAMVVYEVSWHLTWVLSSAETHGACVQYKLILKCVLESKVPKATNRQNNNSADESMTGKKIKNNHGLRQH